MKFQWLFVVSPANVETERMLLWFLFLFLFFFLFEMPAETNTSCASVPEWGMETLGCSVPQSKEFRSSAVTLVSK